jgi:hypothetical protein
MTKGVLIGFSWRIYGVRLVAQEYNVPLLTSIFNRTTEGLMV